MKFRIAILAAGAGTLALAQTDLAQANYAGASASTNAAGSTEIESGPVAKLAQYIGEGKAAKSGSFGRGNGSFQRGNSGSFRKLPKNGKAQPQ